MRFDDPVNLSNLFQALKPHLRRNPSNTLNKKVKEEIQNYAIRFHESYPYSKFSQINRDVFQALVFFIETVEKEIQKQQYQQTTRNNNNNQSSLEPVSDTPMSPEEMTELIRNRSEPPVIPPPRLQQQSSSRFPPATGPIMIEMLSTLAADFSAFRQEEDRRWSALEEKLVLLKQQLVIPPPPTPPSVKDKLKQHMADFEIISS